MDKVQIYYLATLILGTLINLGLHGRPKEGNHDFRIFFVAMLLSIPTAGRIFGWW